MKPKSSDKYGFLEGMERSGQGALGRQIVEAIEHVKWTRTYADASVPAGTRLWSGVSGDFRFILVSFPLDDQGFPGERGADGTVVYPSGLIRLGHQLAEHAVELAMKGAS